MRPLYTPGHTAGMLSFLVGNRADVESAAASSRTQSRSTSATPGGFAGGEAVVFTGDTLFKTRWAACEHPATPPTPI